MLAQEREKENNPTPSIEALVASDKEADKEEGWGYRGESDVLTIRHPRNRSKVRTCK
jgi:hypothetical protein